MEISTKSVEGRSLLSTAEALQLMLAFGGFVLTFVGVVVVLIELKDKRK